MTMWPWKKKEHETGETNRFREEHEEDELKLYRKRIRVTGRERPDDHGRVVIKDLEVGLPLKRELERISRASGKTFYYIVRRALLEYVKNHA